MKPVKNTIDIEREEQDKNRLNPISYIHYIQFRGPGGNGRYWEGIMNTPNYQTTATDSTTTGQTTAGGRVW